MKQQSLGFTITELMVSLVILAVLLAVAAPSYRDFIVDSRMNAEANEFLTMLNFARSEAVKRNGTVTMCKSGDGAGCVDTGNWAQGWIVFVDVDGNHLRNANTETLLRVHGALNEQSSLVGTTSVTNYAMFVPDGRSMLSTGAAQAGRFDLSTSGSSTGGRKICLFLGRSWAEAQAVACPGL